MTGDDGEPQPQAVQQPAGQRPEQRERSPAGDPPLAGGAPPARDSVPPAGPQTLARPSAVLDEAHLGDIEGALGRIRVGEELRGGWRWRPGGSESRIRFRSEGTGTD